MTVLQNGVPYKMFTVKVDGVARNVHIPLQNSDFFKKLIVEAKVLTAETFEPIMAKVQGVAED